MAKEIDTGMDKQDMKRLLMKSKSEPVNCAVGPSDTEKTMALFMLDKVKAPKAVEKELAKKFPNASNTRWGTAFVDTELDAKLVRVTINKPISGLARKLVKTLKGTGFTKVEIVLEDGSPVESESEEEGAPGQPQAADSGDAAAQPAATDPAAEQPVATEAPAEQPPAAPPPPPPQQPQATGPTAAELTQRLTDQVKRIPGVVAANPALKDQLAKFATDAQVNIKTNNLVYAATYIEQLRRALDGAAAAQPQAGGPSAATYEKSRAVWLAARKKIEDEIEKLRAEIQSVYGQEAAAGQIDAAFRAKVAPVITTLDESLAEVLAQAASSRDAKEQAALAKQASDIITGYQKFLANDNTIAELDKNPFVPLQLGPTIAGALDALRKTMRPAA